MNNLIVLVGLVVFTATLSIYLSYPHTNSVHIPPPTLSYAAPRMKLDCGAIYKNNSTDLDNINRQLLYLSVCFEESSKNWIKNHPYTKFVQSSPTRYLIVEDIHGFGNTALTINRLFPIAMLMKRKLLLLHPKDYIGEYFICPLGRGNCWINPNKLEKIAGNGTRYSFSVRQRTYQQCETMMDYADKDVLFAHVSTVFQAGTCLSMLNNSFSQNYFRMLNGLPRIEAFSYGGSFIPLFFSQPSRVVLQEVAKFKKQVSWDSYKYHVGFHYRTCKDCEAHEWSESTYADASDCSYSVGLDLQKKWNSSFDDTLGFMASDDQKAMIPWHKKTPVESLMKVVSYHQKDFVHSDYHVNSKHRKKFLGVFVDWYLLGDVDSCMISRSTFSGSALLRSGYGKIGSVYYHSSMTGKSICKNSKESFKSI